MGFVMRWDASRVLKGRWASGRRLTAGAILTAPRIMLVTVVLAAMPVAWTPAWAQEQQEQEQEQEQESLPPGVPSRPFLMLDTGMHTAPISDLVVDEANGLVATASLDKTIRLWDLETGQHGERLIMPLGDGAEGILHSLDIAPDGGRMIAGGFTGYSWDDGTFSLYTWGLPDQSMMRLKNLPTTIAHTRYRSDGQIFVVGFLSGQGVGVFGSNGQFLGQDRDYDGASVREIAFGPDGRLAVSSDDGTVRLYAPDFRVIAKRTFEGPGSPHGVAFSAQGGYLAVGFSGAARVEIFDSTTLEPRLKVSDPPGASGDTPLVTWINSEETPLVVAAGRRATEDGDVLALAYDPEAKSWAWSVEIGRDSVTALEARPGGGLVFATSDPAWGLVSANGRLQTSHRAGLADFRDVSDGVFAVSDDGQRLVIGVQTGGEEPVTIDLARGRITQGGTVEDGMHAPEPDLPETSQADWRNRTDPAVGSVALTLDRGEAARSLAQLPDNGGFVVGGDFALRVFAADGTERARKDIPAAAYGVVPAAKAPVLVAALGDGTVRWYSLAPDSLLDELASAFYHVSSQRWVVWTPEGFFAHSPGGGQNLVGHVLNRGKAESPMVVDFAQLYRLFHRPDLVWAYLANPLEERARLEKAMADIGDLRQLLQDAPTPEIKLVALCEPEAGQTTRGFVAVAAPTEANEAASDEAASEERCRPPQNLTRAFRRTGDAEPQDAEEDTETVGVLTVAPGQTQITLRFQVTDAGAGVGAIDVFRDGQNVGRTMATRAFRRQGDAPPSDGLAGKKKQESASASDGETSGDAGVPGAPIILDRQVALEEGANLIEIRAYNDAGIYGKTAMTLMVPAAPEAETTQEPEEPGEALWLVSVGVNDYAGEGNDLNYAVPDARSVAAEIAERAAPFYDRVELVELYDGEAERLPLEAALTDLGDSLNRTDSLVLYLAGHGRETEEGLYQFLTPEAYAREGETGLNQQRLVELLGDLPAARKMIFLDTCHAGSFEVSTISGNLYNETGNFILAASASQEEALDSYNGVNGVFAHAILTGLRRYAAVGRERTVSALTLGEFVREEVSLLAEEKGHTQRAVFQGDDTSRFMLGKADDP
ncbi:caspase family protein [Rhodospira trueperi]|uniref:WD40 repeat n=1 Tax=Rhodospira trueperi TaxID=69960 RepID=A0A1G7A9L9_9PROT|nr:caspase family protein [Rhodospira trueperi]SDE11187.1 WD40 repeat [Rhodospira trueperi]